MDSGPPPRATGCDLLRLAAFCAVWHKVLIDSPICSTDNLLRFLNPYRLARAILSEYESWLEFWLNLCASGHEISLRPILEVVIPQNSLDSRGFGGLLAIYTSSSWGHGGPREPWKLGGFPNTWIVGAWPVGLAGVPPIHFLRLVRATRNFSREVTMGATQVNGRRVLVHSQPGSRDDGHSIGGELGTRGSLHLSVHPEEVGPFPELLHPAVIQGPHKLIWRCAEYIPNGDL